MMNDINSITIKPIKKVPGLFVCRRTIVKQKKIIKKLDKKTWIPLSSSNISRKVQHYGYKYNYKSKSIYDSAPKLPDFMKDMEITLTDICKKLKIIKSDYKFNQCIVNNYEKGQAISKHIDVLAYGDVIGCYSIGNRNAIMVFTKGTERVEIKARPKSLYIMSGDARYKWKHEMQTLKAFPKGHKKVGTAPRRISVTFRNVPVKK